MTVFAKDFLTSEDWLIYSFSPPPPPQKSIAGLRGKWLAPQLIELAPPKRGVPHSLRNTGNLFDDFSDGEVCGCPKRLSSSTLSLPSLKPQSHSKACIRDNVSQPYTCFKISCQVIYSQFGLVIHQNDHQARRRFVEWAQNEIAVVPDFHKRILFSDEAHFWLNGYVNKQNCRIWSEANPQVYVETPLHPEKLTVWCALWAGGILLQKR
ncbi:hypothetical protein TNCV_3730131 [Trichonephila clavipes]|nr:hypothetical protein TNCV_3730131 [Trichonephila clavipes]